MLVVWKNSSLEIISSSKQQVALIPCVQMCLKAPLLLSMAVGDSKQVKKIENKSRVEE